MKKPWISPGQAAPANDRRLIQRAEDQPTPSCHLEGDIRDFCWSHNRAKWHTPTVDNQQVLLS